MSNGSRWIRSRTLGGSLITEDGKCTTEFRTRRRYSVTQGTMSGARRRGRPRTAWVNNINTWTGFPLVESIRMTEDSGKEHNRYHDAMMYTITNGLVEVPQEYHPVPRPQNSARGHPRQFRRFQPTVDAFKYAFLSRTIPAWNALPQAVAEADSLDIFKRHMSRHLQF